MNVSLSESLCVCAYVLRERVSERVCVRDKEKECVWYERERESE